MVLDPIDHHILGQLKENGRVSYSSIAQEMKLSSAAVGQRVQKMLEEDVIQGFSTKINPDKVGIHVKAIVVLRIAFGRTEAFRQQLPTFPEIQSCFRITGEDCLIMQTHFNNNAHLTTFIDRISVYGTTKTSIIIDQWV